MARNAVAAFVFAVGVLCTLVVALLLLGFVVWAYASAVTR